MGRIKIKQQSVDRHVMSLLCLVMSHVMSYLSIFMSFWKPFLKYKNAVFNDEQEKESIICVSLG